MKRTQWKVSAPLIFLATLPILLASCSTNSNLPIASNPPASTSVPTSQPTVNLNTGGQQAVAPEQNPTGDIPDTQAFVSYKSTGNYQLEVPEGWARQANQADVSFVEKLDGVQVTVSNATATPTAQSIKADQVPALEKSNQAVKINSVKDVQLQGGKAVLIDYTSNSQPDAVTGKQVRLENNSYLFYKNGKLATLRLYAPQGADNVDQWQRMSNSFRWL